MEVPQGSKMLLVEKPVPIQLSTEKHGYKLGSRRGLDGHPSSLGKDHFCPC